MQENKQKVISEKHREALNKVFTISKLAIEICEIVKKTEYGNKILEVNNSLCDELEKPNTTIESIEKLISKMALVVKKHNNTPLPTFPKGGVSSNSKETFN